MAVYMINVLRTRDPELQAHMPEADMPNMPQDTTTEHVLRAGRGQEHEVGSCCVGLRQLATVLVS